MCLYLKVKDVLPGPSSKQRVSQWQLNAFSDYVHALCVPRLPIIAHLLGLRSSPSFPQTAGIRLKSRFT